VTQKVATHTMLFVYSASHFLHWLLSLLRVPLFGGPATLPQRVKLPDPIEWVAWLNLYRLCAVLMYRFVIETQW